MRYQAWVMMGGLLMSSVAFAQGALNPAEAQRQSHQRQVAIERLAPERRTALQQAELAQMYYRLGRLEDAERAAKDALKARPDDAATLILAGDLQGRRQQWSQAFALFNRAAQLRPQQADIALRQGQALMALGKVQEADAAFARYQALQPIKHREP